MIPPGKAANALFGVMVALLLMMVLVPITASVAFFGAIAVIRALGMHESLAVGALLGSPAIAITASILIAVRVVRASSPTRPRDFGVCATCGYSLEGLPAARCPECGEDFAPSAGNTSR